MAAPKSAMKQLDADSVRPPPASSPSKGMTSPSPTLGKPFLLPLKSSASPTKMKSAPRAKLSPSDLVRLVRADLFQLQSLMDAKESRSLFNYNHRKLEAEVLLLQQSATSPEAELIELMDLYAAKCAETASVLGQGAQSSGPLAQHKKGSSSLTQGRSAIGLVLEAIQKSSAEGAGLAGVGNKSIGDESSGGDGGAVSISVSGQDSPQSIAIAVTKEGEIPILVTDDGPHSLLNGPGVVGSQFSSNVSLGGARMAPMSAGSLATLAHLGIDLPPFGHEVTLDTDAIIKQLVHAARVVQTKEANLDHRVQATKEMSVVRQRQAEIEVEVQRSTLRETETELEELRRTMQSSRFGPNQVRTLATVKDAPMSFQVERQYQRDIQCAKLRVQEMEQKYQALWDSGTEDRETVKRLKEDVRQLKQQIVDLNQALKKANSERDENVSLFRGVSQARNEEARMSLVAVKQLETRVAELEHEVAKEKEEKKMLAENFMNLFTECNKFERLMLQSRNRQESTVDSFNDYKQLFHTELVQQVSSLQQELLRVYRQSDEQEATITMLKQQLEDAEVLRNLSVQESTIFMEKLKSSTEWKMVGVRAAEESKQLAMRLVVLNGDKEKKESGMAQQQHDRLVLYRARADKEIVERTERRQREIQPIDSEAVESEWKQRMQKRHVALEEKAAGKPMEKVKQALKLKNDYAEECLHRLVNFVDYFNEKFPSDD